MGLPACRRVRVVVSRSRGECDGVEGVTPVDETAAWRDAVPE